MAVLKSFLFRFWTKLYGGELAKMPKIAREVTETLDTVYEFYATRGLCKELTEQQYLFIHTFILEDEFLVQLDDKIFDLDLSARTKPPLSNPDWDSWLRLLRSEVIKRQRIQKLRTIFKR
jgi:hypothetical protein